MQIIKANPLNNEDLENLGLSWHTDVDNTPYVSDEIIEVKHTALSKEVFVQGAISACLKIVDKDNGLFSLKNLY